jgi:hypothetical protein
MFGFIRSRLLYAGQIGWLDGRRGYPAENDFVDLPLRGVQALSVVPAPASAPHTPPAPHAAHAPHAPSATLPSLASVRLAPEEGQPWAQA